MKKLLFVLVIGGIISAGCATGPYWVQKGGFIEGSYVYGVGTAPGDDTAFMKRKIADTRARTDVASVLHTKGSVKVLNNGEKSTVAITEMDLVNCEIVERWTDPKTGDIYSLARMIMPKKDN